MSPKRRAPAPSRRRAGRASSRSPGPLAPGSAAAHRYGFKINEGTQAAARAGRAGVYVRRVQGVQAAADRCWAGRGARGGRGGGASAAASPPRGRVRVVVARECRAAAGVSPRALGGGGEPRAARLDAARGRSAPPPRAPSARARRRARSAAPAPPEPPRPRLRPVFLWARQLDGTVQEVRCEDYDARNRLRLARTASGWRVIPRTEIYNAIRVPPPPARAPRERRRRRRCARSRRRARAPEPALWQPDLESHIPSHTIAVPRAPPEPTPLDNLLAVAELEFNQQLDGAAYSFLPAEQVARDVMSFELGEPEPSDELGAHKDLFETISEAHYLPELGGPHDEELLESLVEKGCEDNQILVDQALDKLSHLVHGTGEYGVEDDMLLSDAPVSEIMNRLEQTLESPGQSSITAAQGLLHLHHIGDHLSQASHAQVEQSYMSEEVFAPEDASQCPMESLTAAANELQDMNDLDQMEYDAESAEKTLDPDIDNVHGMCTERVPDSLDADSENKTYHELEPEALPDQSEADTPIQTSDDVTSGECLQTCEELCTKADDEQNIEETNEEEVEKTTDEPADDNNGDIDHREEPVNEDLVPTDLSIKNVDKSVTPLIAPCDTDTPHFEDNMSIKSEEQPRDLTVHRRLPTPQASPRRTEVPRAPSRESDAMQSPQPSGIPAVPSSPEIFTMPLTKSKQTLFLETLLSSPSPKMYTSEVTITKQQCEPLNLGKHRKSASPTVSSCSDEMKKLNKEFGEPQEKKMKHESSEELAKVSKVFKTEEQVKKPDMKMAKTPSDDASPLKQLLVLKSNPEFNVPDPLLIPKDKLNGILLNPGQNIPALLMQRPELRLPQAFAYPAVLQDPDILVVSLSQLETILENEEMKSPSPRPPKDKDPKSITSSKQPGTPQPDQTGQPKPIPSMDALAGDIDAATSAALNQMLWLPYLSQLEAMAACSQNMDFLKALNSAGYTGPNYPELSQMFNPSHRFMPQRSFAVMPPLDYDNGLQMAMWQEAMSHANASHNRSKGASVEQLKELSKSSEGAVQNPYVHSTKSHPTKTHSSARTSPIAHSYNQRGMAHHPFLQGMYPGMTPNVRPNVPLPGLQIPYFNPSMMGNQRSPRTGQQKSPSSPYYPNNNYLQSLKQAESQNQRHASQDSPRPRISVKSLHNLLEPSAAAASGVGARRASSTPTAHRRREEPEVGSTTPGEPAAQLPPHPHDPASFHLWHPLFVKNLTTVHGVGRQ
ncbi:uncharacterized protein LOC112057661 isoform X2 [Bicyclus anynana]|uniref:Uncharacterized protein LOC112057661 isoform X2 n=1 Tax=Bicyclus anynana TaxID=110368 RepID=A0ABM3LQJ7_BICAN|nr:uncharacterized protein LOC112057661 isoform X2 [Bicyclus anynana]